MKQTKTGRKIIHPLGQCRVPCPLVPSEHLELSFNDQVPFSQDYERMDSVHIPVP